MEQRNEPTTAEIVEEYKRVTSDAWRACDGCDLKALLRQSIARLKQLERENAELRGELYSDVAEEFIVLLAEYAIEDDYKLSKDAIEFKKQLIIASEKVGFVPLSRAEKAEAERDAAINALERLAKMPDYSSQPVINLQEGNA